MAEIHLRNKSGNVVAIARLDDADHALFADLRWHAHFSDTKTYAARVVQSRGQRHRWFLHRAILGLAPDDQRRADHINGDTLDNRRSNLRVVTTAGNAQNQGSRGGSSRFRGVSWDRSRSKWMASATLNGRRVTIGRFDDEEVAGLAARDWRAEHMPYTVESEAA